MALSIAIALVVTWAAIALSYQTNGPVGFYVGVISAMSYAAGRNGPTRAASGQPDHPSAPTRHPLSPASGTTTKPSAGPSPLPR